jgi:hypothetical protein
MLPPEIAFLSSAGLYNEYISSLYLRLWYLSAPQPCCLVESGPHAPGQLLPILPPYQSFGVSQRVQGIANLIQILHLTESFVYFKTSQVLPVFTYNYGQNRSSHLHPTEAHASAIL